MLDAKLNVRVYGRHGDYYATMTIPEVLELSFHPMDICEDRTIASVVGGISAVDAKKVIRVRKDAAEVLANNIAKMLLDFMSAQDTINGYQVDKGR